MRFVDDGVKTIDEMGSFTKDKIPYIAGDNNTESYVWLEKVSSLLKCKNGIVCEIGSRLGGGIVTMMNGLKFDRNFYYIGIDPYGSFPYPNAVSKDALYSNDMRSIFLTSINYVCYDKKINFQFYPMTSSQFIKRFEDGVPVYDKNGNEIILNNYSLVHIDGNHLYDSVKEETFFFLNRMQKNGIIVYDNVNDYDHYGKIESILLEQGIFKKFDSFDNSSWMKESYIRI